MKQTIRVFLLILLSLNLANCEEGGGGDSSGSLNTLKITGDYIHNLESDLGPIAQYLVNNDANFNEFFFATNAGNGEKTYNDSQILFAIRGYLNAKTKTVDVQGEMDVLAETPLDAFTEAVYVADGSSRGVSARGLCYLTADVLNSFGIDVSLVLLDGVSHSLAPDGQYCTVEAHLPNGDVMIDSYLNRSWYRAGGIQHHSTLELGQVIANGELTQLNSVADGMATAMPGWSPLNGFYQTYESTIQYNTTRQEEIAREVMDSTFDNFQVIPYSEMRN